MVTSNEINDVISRYNTKYEIRSAFDVVEFYRRGFPYGAECSFRPADNQSVSVTLYISEKSPRKLRHPLQRFYKAIIAPTRSTFFEGLDGQMLISRSNLPWWAGYSVDTVEDVERLLDSIEQSIVTLNDTIVTAYIREYSDRTDYEPIGLEPESVKESILAKRIERQQQKIQEEQEKLARLKACKRNT